MMTSISPDAIASTRTLRSFSARSGGVSVWKVREGPMSF
jgi:hypothetical protein